MSYIYSRALVEEFSLDSCSDTERFAQSRTTPTPNLYLSKDKTTELCQHSRYGMTLGHLTEMDGEELLTSFQEGFRARIYQLQERERGLTPKGADCGLKWQESLARYDQNTHSLKIAQCSLNEGLTGCFVILPKWGTMRNGWLSERQTLEGITTGKESGYWATPCATDWKGSPKIQTVKKQGTNSQIWGKIARTHSQAAWDRYREQDEPRILGEPNDLAHRVDRLKCIGNGQVPIVAATAFKILLNRINGESNE